MPVKQSSIDEIKNIAPHSLKLDSKSKQLTLGSVSLTHIAQESGTPCYILDQQTIVDTVQKYQAAFKDYPEAVHIQYACKANCSTGLLKLLDDLGLGFDVVSGGELFTAIQADIDLNKVLMNGNNKSPEELEMAILSNIGLISVDNPDYELPIIHNICTRTKKKVSILLRVTPGIDAHTHDYIKTGHIDSKFGINLPQLNETISKLINEYKETIQLCGLHAHIGSQIFDLDPYLDLIDVLFSEYEKLRKRHGITLTHMDIGGGLGIYYTQQDDPPDISLAGQSICKKIVATAKKHNYPLPQLLLEPGRSIIAQAGVTLYTVGAIKHIPELNKTYVSVNGGMGDNIRPALYGAKYTAIVANKAHEPASKTVTIAGKYCESGDILFPELQVPESITTGDLLLVLATGAYNYSMSSQYNRIPRPGTVMVNNGCATQLVKRETYHDIIRQDLLPLSN